MELRQITVVGTGLIGGSFALALRRSRFAGRIVGCDSETVLARARELGVIDEGVGDAVEAARSSDAVVLAVPIGAILDLIPRLAPALTPHALLTDVGSTKTEIVGCAIRVFGAEGPRCFLPGHPMAGKEDSGIEHADADLFRGAAWLVTPLPGQELVEPRIAAFCRLIESIGARVVVLDAERHDRLCAWASHLPQMLSTALAAELADLGENLRAVSGGGLADMTRLASSPYSLWRDIAMTNTKNIEEALLRLEHRLAHMRENLRTLELRAEFDHAQEFRIRHRDPET